MANELSKKYQMFGRNPILLDGDSLREVLNTNSFSRESRVENGLIYSRLAKLLQNQGHIVIVAVIGMYHEVYKENRFINNYFECFLDVPIDELASRDSKSIYQRYNAGEIKNVAGLDLKIDIPCNPTFHFQWAKDNPLILSEIVDHVWQCVEG